MDKLLVQTSKLGDILGIIPICYAAHLRGERYGIMASKEFADILDGCSYVEKVVFDEKPWEIEKAVEQANKLCEKVVVTQTNGIKSVIEKFAYEPAGQKHAVTDSFNRESWKLAGCLRDWGKVPLVFDKRDKEREKLLMPDGWFGRGKKKRIMLVSAGSASSPFPYRELLLELVNLKYGKTFNIVDLSTIKAERFYDLLGLYEAAHCMITVDTSHLHLAYAVPNLPVMALIQDRPIYWYGSAWRPSHHFHCRYRDFPSRALELFTAIDAISDTNTAPNILHVYHGEIRRTDYSRKFAIQYGACRRDAVNVLNDKEHFPMLQDAIRMFMQVAKPNEYIALSRQDTKFSCAEFPNPQVPCFAWRMNLSKDDLETFFPAVDLFAAPVDFWVRIFPLIPDIVFDSGAYWSRLLMEIFKANGAVEIEGIYRNE